MARAFISTWPALDVLTVNHAEYPLWPQQRRDELLVCFCEACREKAAARGFELESVGPELRRLSEQLANHRQDRHGSVSDLLRRSIAEPPIAEWLAFRRDAVSECVERVVAASREAAATAGKTVAIGLEFQLPALAPLVGSDFERLSAAVDFLVAKFPDYLAAAVLPGLAKDAQLPSELRAFLDLGTGPREYALATDPSEGIRYANAFDHDVFDLQRPRLETVWGRKPIHAYLWKYGGDDADLRAKVRAIEDRGFDGYFLWVWNRDLDEGGPQSWSLPRFNREGVL